MALPGADFISVEDHKICSVQGYFDQRTLAEQLGLQVIVQPYTSGPVSFGTSVFLQTGKRSKPGAFSLTSISVRSDAEKAELQEYGRRIMTEMVQMPGLISAMTVRPVGHRSFTIAAWEDPDSPRQMAQGEAHREAMERFFGPDFAAGAMTSVWVPHVSTRYGCGVLPASVWLMQIDRTDSAAVDGRCQNLHRTGKTCRLT